MTVKDLLELYKLVKKAEEEDIDIEDIEDVDIEDIEDIDIEDVDIEDVEDEDEVKTAEEMLDYADALEKTAELYRYAALGKVKNFLKKYWKLLAAAGGGAGAGAAIGYATKRKKRKKKAQEQAAQAVQAVTQAAKIPIKERIKNLLMKNWKLLAAGGGGLLGGYLLSRLLSKDKD